MYAGPEFLGVRALLGTLGSRGSRGALGALGSLGARGVLLGIVEVCGGWCQTSTCLKEKKNHNNRKNQCKSIYTAHFTAVYVRCMETCFPCRGERKKKKHRSNAQSLPTGRKKLDIKKKAILKLSQKLSQKLNLVLGNFWGSRHLRVVWLAGLFVFSGIPVARRWKNAHWQKRMARIPRSLRFFVGVLRFFWHGDWAGLWVSRTPRTKDTVSLIP